MSEPEERLFDVLNQEVKADSIPFSNHILNRIHSRGAIFVSPAAIWQTVKGEEKFC